MAERSGVRIVLDAARLPALAGRARGGAGGRPHRRRPRATASSPARRDARRRARGAGRARLRPADGGRPARLAAGASRRRRSRPSSRARGALPARASARSRQGPEWPGAVRARSRGQLVHASRTSRCAARVSRRATLSPARFRRIALATAVMLVLIVATGATVRLTGSGLGCEHWPGCQPHLFRARASTRTSSSRTAVVGVRRDRDARCSRSRRWRIARPGRRVTAGSRSRSSSARSRRRRSARSPSLRPEPAGLVIALPALARSSLTLAVLVALEASAARSTARRALRCRRSCGSVGARARRRRAVLIVSGHRRRPRPARIPGSRTRSAPRVVRARRLLARARDGRLRDRVPRASSGSSAGRGAPHPCCSRGCSGCSASSSCRWRSARCSTGTHLPWWLVLVHVTLGGDRRGLAVAARRAALAAGGRPNAA